MRKIIKIGLYTIGGILVVVIVYIALIFYPDIFFANHVKYGNFTVHSDQQFGDELEIALRDIEAALVTSEIYDPNIEHDIYLGYGKKVFQALQNLTVNTNTYNRSSPPYVSQIITFRKPDFRANTLSLQQGGAVNLRQILTHEVVHTLLNLKLGERSIRYPMWKTEGYCDYIAASTSTLADPSYDIRASVRRILGQDLSWMKDDHGNFIQMRRIHVRKSLILNEEGIWWSTSYYISRVLWEYLLNVKGLKFDEVMGPEVTDIDTLTELIGTYKSGNL